jgi:hypothetical protein
MNNGERELDEELAMRYTEDFRYGVGDKVRYTGVGDFSLPEGAQGVVIAVAIEGQYPYRVRFEERPDSHTYGYLMTELELEPA